MTPVLHEDQISIPVPARLPFLKAIGWSLEDQQFSVKGRNRHLPAGFSIRYAMDEKAASQMVKYFHRELLEFQM
jgi:hypothetical protein